MRMVAKSMSSEEKKWRLEDDVRTLRNYAELKSDKNRYDAAVKSLKESVADVQKVIDNTK